VPGIVLSSLPQGWCEIHSDLPGCQRLAGCEGARTGRGCTYVSWRLGGIGRSRVGQILSLDRRILGRLLGILVVPAYILALSAVKHCAAYP
jgi:hypothetical protein